jgi:uncharacterized protein involved in response to NO
MKKSANRVDRINPALQVGFRPFFLCASAFAAVAMVLWGLLYFGVLPARGQPLPASYWHAHVMIYGYAMAVVAGFLLTAVSNWTGRKTTSGGRLLLVAGLWLGARIAWLPGLGAWQVAALLDGLFSVSLLLGILPPVIRARQWRQMAVLSKVILLMVGNACCYLAIAGIFPFGLHIGIYGGFFLLIGLVMTLARRVIPFFIESALPDARKPRNSRVLDISSLILFLVLFINEIFLQQALLSSVSAMLLFLVNAIRLLGWHVPGIWGNSMLWSLYLSQWMIAVGFLLLVGRDHLGYPASLAIHAMSVGGIGLVTSGMMARVALGHTGRPVNSPPPGVGMVFLLIVISALARVAMPALWPEAIDAWITLSLVAWTTAFILFFLVYRPILIGPRVN